MKRIVFVLKKIIPYLVISVIGVFLTITLINLYGFKKKTDDYIAITNVPYSNNFYSKRNKMDIYLPRFNSNETKEVGMILYIHGGAWVAGDKEGYTEELKSMAKDNYVVASMNYHYVSKKVDVFDILDEITMCLNKSKSIAKKYNIDITGAMLTGGSAGAHLSMLYGYSRAKESTIEVKAVYAQYGPTDLTSTFYRDTDPLKEKYHELFSNVCGKKFSNDSEYNNAYELLLKASPINYASTAVPTVFVYGINDQVINPNDNVRMSELLCENNIPNEIYAMPNSGHGYDGVGDETLARDHTLAFKNYFNTYVQNKN